MLVGEGAIKMDDDQADLFAFFFPQIVDNFFNRFRYRTHSYDDIGSFRVAVVNERRVVTAGYL